MSVTLYSSFIKYHTFDRLFIWTFCISGAAINMLPVDRPQPRRSSCPWNCSHVQDWQSQVRSYCSQLDTEVCYGMIKVKELLAFVEGHKCMDSISIRSFKEKEILEMFFFFFLIFFFFFFFFNFFLSVEMGKELESHFVYSFEVIGDGKQNCNVSLLCSYQLNGLVDVYSLNVWVIITLWFICSNDRKGTNFTKGDGEVVISFHLVVVSRLAY